MKKGFPISRNVRAQWLIQHLDSVINIHQRSEFEGAPELEVISVVPFSRLTDWSAKTSLNYSYKVTTSTSVVFLAYKYRMVFSLDYSPSLTAVVSEFFLSRLKFFEQSVYF